MSKATITVRIRGGTKKAKQLARRFGEVVSCKLAPGVQGGPVRYSPHGSPRGGGGRISECKVACGNEAGGKIRRYFWKNQNGQLLDFKHDQCPPPKPWL